MNYDNPAARLLTLLEAGKTKNKHENCRVVWQQLLEVENNNPLLMSRIGKAMELPELTIQAIREQYPNQTNTWAHWETQVNNAFMEQNLNSQWTTFIQHIDAHSINFLRLSADLLQAKSNTKTMTDEELSKLRDNLHEIYSEIINAEIDEEVKKYLVRNLRKLITSIDEYKLTGALPLLDTIESTIGHIHIDSNYKNFLKNSELGGRLLDNLSAMANILTVAIGIPQLSQLITLIGN